MLDGYIKTVLFKTIEDLHEAMERRNPGSNKEGNTVWAVYRPLPDYNYIGELWFVVDATPESIVHELYHAIQHYRRMNQFGLFSSPTGSASKKEMQREEREALMIATLFINVQGFMNTTKELHE